MANYSRQREAILNELKNRCDHPTAKQVYEGVRKRMPNISLGTVYRNLKFLCDSGQAIALETADKKIHYDGCVNNHRHFICNKCGKIYDLMPTPVEEPYELLQNGFTISRESCVYYGNCKNCTD